MATTVDLTTSLINPGRELLASAARFVSSMKKRITAAQPSPPPSTPSTPSLPTPTTHLSPSTSTSLAPTVDRTTTSSPFSSSTLRAHLNSLSRRFSLPLQDAVKKQQPVAVAEFNDLYAEVSRLEEKADLPADVEVQVSGLYERMKVLKEAVQRWGGELRTSEEVEAVKEEAMRKVRDTEAEMHEEHLQQLREEREKHKRGAARRRRRQRAKEEEEEEDEDSGSDAEAQDGRLEKAPDANGDGEGKEEEEDEEVEEKAEAMEDDEEEVTAPATVKPTPAKKGGPSVSVAVQAAKRAKVSEDVFAFSPASSSSRRFYSLKRPVQPPVSRAVLLSPPSASAHTPVRPSAASSPSSSTSSRRRASLGLSTPVAVRRVVREVEAAPEVREVKKRRVVEEKDGLSVLVSQAEHSRRNLSRETRHMKTERQQSSRDGEKGKARPQESSSRVTRSRA